MRQDREQLAMAHAGKQVPIIRLHRPHRPFVGEAVEPVGDEFLQEVADTPALQRRLVDEACHELDVKPDRHRFGRRRLAPASGFRRHIVGHTATRVAKHARSNNYDKKS